jgi:hypothetical protein
MFILSFQLGPQHFLTKCYLKKEHNILRYNCIIKCTEHAKNENN